MDLMGRTVPTVRMLPTVLTVRMPRMALMDLMGPMLRMDLTDLTGRGRTHLPVNRLISGQGWVYDHLLIS